MIALFNDNQWTVELKKPVSAMQIYSISIMCSKLQLNALKCRTSFGHKLSLYGCQNFEKGLNCGILFAHLTDI